MSNLVDVFESNIQIDLEDEMLFLTVEIRIVFFRISKLPKVFYLYLGYDFEVLDPRLWDLSEFLCNK